MKSILLPAAMLLALSAPTTSYAASNTRSDVGERPSPRIVYPEQADLPVKGLGTHDSGRAALHQYASAFDGGNGATYRLRPGETRVTRGDGETKVLRYAQSIGGVEVFGAELVAAVRPDGRTATLAGEASRVETATLDLTPALTQHDATAVARAFVAKHASRPEIDLTADVDGLRIFDPALVGFGPGVREAGLVWEVSVGSNTGVPVRRVVLVDAAKGHVLLSYSTIHPMLGAPALATFTSGNDILLPGTPLCDESTEDCTAGVDIDADNAHRFARGVYDLYADLHQRDGVDGNGMATVSSVHFSIDYCNAFWDTEWLQMVYGDGCNIVLDDVVGHELTHGVTDFTSGLIYAYESGAINESLSDVWGEYFDVSNASPDDTPEVRWVMAEEIDGGFRSMRDPQSISPGGFVSPDRMLSPDFWIDPLDFGGVHFNSGVNNKAAYLMADGDTFNGQHSEGLGLEKPLHIYYYVQTTLLTPTSNYADLGHYLSEGCKDLIGSHDITAADCDQVEKAVLATEMREQSPLQPDEAPVCSAGKTPLDVVFDDFEDGVASKERWAATVDTGANAWIVSSLQAPVSGQRSLRADNLDVLSDSSAMLVDAIEVPADAWLHFRHAYVWEYDSYDGSVPQFSTDNGMTWTTFAPELLQGERYPGMVQSDASISGQEAFAGDSLGVGSTRIDLSAFAGQSLRLRFLASTDQSFDAGAPDGWWIDDVRVYTCVLTQPDVFSDDFE